MAVVVFVVVQVFCTSEGIVCGGIGTCVDFGCTCEREGEETAEETAAGGDFCTADQTDSESAGTRSAPLDVYIVAAVTTVATALSAVLVVSTPSPSPLSSLPLWSRRRRQSRRIYETF